MIVELIYNVSAPKKEYSTGGYTYQSTLFPDTAKHTRDYQLFKDTRGIYERIP